MDKYEITRKIQEFAPEYTQEEWDCSGWAVEVEGYNEINKVMLCLTVTNNIIKQAKEQNCDMIISHHPCFYVPTEWSDINIYCAHTNLDKANGGTTDTLIAKLGLEQYKIQSNHEYLRFIENKFTIEEFSNIIRKISPYARIINNSGIKQFHKIAFCSGSGSEFIQDAKENGADCLVTGDLKFHTALHSPIAIYDIGHFESEIIILPVIKEIINQGCNIIYADEKSPFCNI